MKRLALVAIFAVVSTLSFAQGTPSAFPYAKLVPNDTATGTTQFTLTKINSSGNAVIMATTDTNGYAGICVENCGTVGSAWIAFAGLVPVKVDGSTTVQHYIQISGSTGGTGHDTGAITYPTSGGSVIGRVQAASTGANSFSMVDLFPAEDPSASSGGSLTVNGSGAATNLSNTTPAAPTTNPAGGRNLTFQISGANASAYAIGFMPRPDVRENVISCRPQGGSNNFACMGIGNTATTSATARNGPSSGIPATVTFASGASAGTNGGYIDAGANTRTGTNIWYDAGFQLAGTTNERFWIGLTDSTGSTLAAADSIAATHTIALRYSTNASDTQWQCVTTNGTTQTTTSSATNVDTSFHRLIIIGNDSVPNYQFFLDGVQICGNITATIPANSNMQAIGWIDQIGVGAAVTFNSNGYYIEGDH